MKLATLHTPQGDRLVGVSPQQGQTRYVDLTAADPTLPSSMRQLLSRKDGLRIAAVALAEGERRELFVTGRLAAPIRDPGKIVCIGLNYADHAAESGLEPPSEPVVFSKFGNTITGPDEPIKLPAVSSQVDYEAELVVVIGRRGHVISRERAWSHVAGYMNGHDVSARDWQINRPGKQWLLGKTADTFAPIGPWLVTADEIADPHNLSVQLRLNGRTMQQGNTQAFIFGIDVLIAHISQLMTLEPGDIIFTGTPPGVGMGRKPPVWLQAGDVCEVEIEGLGLLRNPVQAG